MAEKSFIENEKDFLLDKSAASQRGDDRHEGAFIEERKVSLCDKSDRNAVMIATKVLSSEMANLPNLTKHRNAVMIATKVLFG